MQRPQLVIFDCDGVLVDSEPIASRVLAETLSTLGWHLKADDVDEKFRGRSLRDCQKEIEAHLGRALPVDFIDRLNERTYSEFETSLEPVPGVREAIETVLGHGVLVCVASSGSHEKIRFTLGHTGLLPLFGQHLFSASEVARGKPAPDLFLYAAAKMNVFPEHALVVEDSEPGVKAARAATIPVLGYAGSGNRHALERSGATVFESMAELPALLQLR